jgi:E3 ubiquitin-protein ligase HUWE1
MGKITKTLQTKHKESYVSFLRPAMLCAPTPLPTTDSFGPQTPWLQEFVETASSTSLPTLPRFLATFPSRWPFPRGDLYHWIPLLNRFDTILETFVSTYKLSDGPQLRDFGCDVLLGSGETSTDGTQQWDMSRLSELGYDIDGDATLIVAILKFTKMLLNHCGNRSIYASSAHLNELLNSTDYDVICATLRVGVELAKRYQASVKRMGGTSRPLSQALLSNHYNIELDRVQQLAQPFVKTPIVKATDPLPLATPIGSASKGRSPANNKSAVSMYANDLCAIAKPATPDASDSRAEARWNGWGDVRLTYYPVSGPSQPAERPSHPERAAPSSTPSTPTPLRRSNSANVTHTTPRSARHQASEDSPSPSFRSPAWAASDATTPGQKSVDVPQSVVVSTPVYQLLERTPADVTKEARYEFLNRLRVAKALTGSLESRQHALQARLLAIQNLAYIHTEGTFIEKVLKQDSDEPRRFQLIYQLAELIHPSADGSSDAPTGLQAIALGLLEAMTSFHSKIPDIFSALNATVNHGVLLYVIRKAVAEMKEDDTGDQYTDADEWRDNLFSLTLHITMAMTNSTARTTPEIISAGLLDIMTEILTIRSNIAERTHATLLTFLDNLVYNVQTSSLTIINAEGLDAITDLITHEVDLARKLLEEERGTPPSCRSLVVDYEIPFYQQQNLKWLLKFIHHLMTNAFAYGGNTDRLLRNLVDKSALLRSLREITMNASMFGSLVWTSTASILSDFLNNDPTSFAAISEAGLVQTFLESITGRPVTMEQPPTPAATSGNETSDTSSPSSIDPDDRPHPPTLDMLAAPRPEPLARGIRPSPDAINVVPTVLNAISLNNQGIKMVASSRAFESFFEIFESPDHVRVMASTDPDLASNIGNSFDELARHHPALRPAITNAVLDMVARLVHLGKAKANESGWGAKLVVQDASGTSILADSSLLDAQASDKGKGKAVNNTPDAPDTDISDPDAQYGQGTHFGTEMSSPQKSILPYIYAVSMFLSHYINNAQPKQPLVHKGMIELLLDLCTSPSLPHHFGQSPASRMLHGTITQLVESSPVIGMPSLLKRTREAVEALEPLTSSSASCFFAPFLGSDAIVTNDLSTEKLGELANGTPVVKALLNIQSLVRALQGCFPYSSRAQALTYPAVNSYDYYNQLASSLGTLMGSVASQQEMCMRCVPLSWVHPKKDKPAQTPNGVTNNETLDVPTAGEEALLSAIVPPSGIALPFDRSGSIPKSEQSTSRFRNFETVTTILQSILPAVFPLLYTLGRALLTRRPERGSTPERDSYIRAQHIKLAHTLAETLVGQLDVSNEEVSVKQFHHWVIMTQAVNAILVDRKYDGGRTERQGVHLVASVLVAFKQKGGFERLNAMLRVFSEHLGKDAAATDGDETSLSKLALIGTRKILEFYALAANGKTLSDSALQTGFLNRSTNRTAEAQSASNLVAQVRVDILPAIQELWQSPLAEKGPADIVNKIIDILKSISTADAENAAYRRSDKSMPPVLLKQEHVKFAWTSVAASIAQLKGEGYEDDLAREGVYRANGSVGSATDYCKAHKAGIAGSRNPIPEYDAPGDELDELASASADSEASRPEASASASASNDQPMMDVDLPADIPAGLLEEEILGEFRDAAGAAGGDLTASQLFSGRSDANGGSSSSAPQATAPTAAEATAPGQSPVPREDLDAARASLRENLIDRCLEVITAHPATTYDISALINAAVIRSSSDDSTKQEIGETLVNALISFTMNDDLKPQGRSIAAFAHLLSLLLQDRGFFHATVSSLRDNVKEFLKFLQVSSPPTEDLAPWIPYILLIFEILLSDDEQPSDIRWKAPSNEDEPIEPLQWSPKDLIVKEEHRRSLLDAVLGILPKVGKAESLAISVLRILVILTRDRTTARAVGDKKNLQRLFVMTKQLSGFGSARLSETRISSHVLTILRHIIEDEEIIKQIIRSEIQFVFENARTQRPTDLAGYTRQLSHLALRDPRLFVEVSNEMIRLTRWNSGEGSASHRQTVILKEKKVETPKDDVAPTVRATEDLSIQDVKPSTETEDKHMTDAPKHSSQDSKRPILENPDGVIHFLLCELLNYREVDDKEPTQAAKDPKDADAKDTKEPELATPSNEASENKSSDNKDKRTKPTFKPEEHPIFVYRCFILRCLIELLQSYNQTKVEFINFKRSAPLQTNTPIKPRTSVLNYLLTDLICASPLDGSSDSLTDKKRAATAHQTQNLLVALMTKTSEKPIDRSREKYDYDEDPDFLFVRKFVLDTILKAYKDASTSNEAFDLRYGRMLALAEVMYQIMGADKDKEMPASRHHPQESFPDRSHAQVRRLMYEKGYLGTLTASIADIDLAFPPVKKTIKHILRVLRTLTSAAIQLSNAGILPVASSVESVEDDIASATSLSDIEDDREETPDLYRNSALGMLEPGRDPEEDYSEGSEDGKFPIENTFMNHALELTLVDDEEMYDEEYGDEMEYEEEVSVDGEENVSDEDEEVEGMEGMGHIEGLPGDLGVVEVTMDEDDEDDEDDMDDDDEGDSEDDDELGSDMDDADDRIEIVDDEGNPVEDDGASGWENETDDDEDEDEDIDYEAEAQDLEEAHIHALEDVPDLGRFGNIMRAIEEDDDYDGADDLNANPYPEEDEEDGTLSETGFFLDHWLTTCR